MDLLESYPIISEQLGKGELSVILRELRKVLEKDIPGDIVEMGCYEGTSALFEARLLEELAPDRQLWLYDSFEGLPDKDPRDESPAGLQFKVGALTASRRRLKENFRKAGLRLPHIRKAWFRDLAPADLPPKICFAFLDGDYYYSIKDSLKLVWSKIPLGGIVIVDDYQNEALPGAAAAVDEWLASHKAKLAIEASLAIISVL